MTHYTREAPAGDIEELHRMAALVRVTDGSSQFSVERLGHLLSAIKPELAAPYIDLARAQIRQQEFKQVLKTVERILELKPDHTQAAEWRGLAQIGMKQVDEAIETLESSLKSAPNRPEAHYNLGLAFTAKDRYDDALSHFQAAADLRPNFAAAWFYSARTLGKLGRTDQAVESYRRALEIDPTHTRAYLGIGETLIASGNRPEAMRFYRHGLKAAAQATPIAQADGQTKSERQLSRRRLTRLTGSPLHSWLPLRRDTALPGPSR